MDSTPLNIEQILENIGGASINSLKEIMENIENDHEIETIRTSSYYSLDNLPHDIRENPSNFFSP